MKGEESAEAKIKSFDEVKKQFLFLICLLGCLQNQDNSSSLSSDSPEVQIHGEQPGFPEKKAESTG